MGWRTVGQKIGFEVNDTLKNVYDQVKNIFDKAVGNTKANFTSLVAGTSFIGINGAKIPYMREAIRTYVKAAQENLDKMEASISTVNAFRGDYAAAVTNYVGTTKKMCQDIIECLLAFSDKLDMIAEAYHQRDEEFASSINSSASEASSTTQGYTEQRSDKTYGNGSASYSGGAGGNAGVGLASATMSVK